MAMGVTDLGTVENKVRVVSGMAKDKVASLALQLRKAVTCELHASNRVMISLRSRGDLANAMHKARSK
ncbi:MAG: hypothetical protein EBU88_19360 [Acidobacteria bacterium]|nr:hypothetical protein [Acidobacteriota bacterium]